MSSPNGSRSPEAVARKFLTALGNQDTDQAASCFAPDIVQEMPFAPPGFPDRREGYDAVRQMYAALPQLTRSIEFVVLNAYPITDGEHVLVEFQGKIVQNSGSVYDNHYFGLFRVIDGLISNYREIFNPVILLNSLTAADVEAAAELALAD
ncbi:MAG TPA: nuclear transport factor 2 family protein [Pseudonocardiaceae bacterium]|nr:nuclear transport factor 2 family protein [Pseudonocardiaceae bacterium]